MAGRRDGRTPGIYQARSGGVQGLDNPSLQPW